MNKEAPGKTRELSCLKDKTQAKQMVDDFRARKSSWDCEMVWEATETEKLRLEKLQGKGQENNNWPQQ